MRMLRWMCGVTRKDKIRNECIRGTTRVAQASKEIPETIELVQACDGRRWTTHTEESVENQWIHQRKGREGWPKTSLMMLANETWKVLDRKQARKGWSGEGRSSVIAGNPTWRVKKNRTIWTSNNYIVHGSTCGHFFIIVLSPRYTLIVYTR